VVHRTRRRTEAWLVTAAGWARSNGRDGHAVGHLDLPLVALEGGGEHVGRRQVGAPRGAIDPGRGDPEVPGTCIERAGEDRW
jgi:hypothetical protein